MNAISLIVCAKDEERVISRLLESLSADPTDEVVFVLDRCTDRTKQIIENFALSCQRKIVEITENPWNDAPKKFAVLQGILNSSHQQILFTDADCVLSKNHFAINRALFEKSEVVIGFSIPEKEPVSFLEKMQFVSFIWTAAQYSFFASLKLPHMTVGRNWGFKKKLFKTEFLTSHQHIKSGDDDLLFQQLLVQNPVISLNKFTNVSTSYLTSWHSLIRQKLRHQSAGIKYKLHFKIILSGISLIEIGLILFAAYNLLLLNFQALVICISFLFIFYVLFLSSITSFLKHAKLNTIPITSFLLIKPINALFISIISLFSLSKNPNWK